MGCGCGPYQPDGCGNTVAGQLVPPGGTDGQLLAKASDGAFDVEWVDPPTPPVVEGFATSAELEALEQQVTTNEEARLLLEQEVWANALTTIGHTTQLQSLYIDPDMPRSPVDGYVLKFDAALGDDGLWTAMPDLQGAPGSGTGDMLQATYDVDNNGIVDNAERLGGNLPSHFATADHDHDGIYADADHAHDGTYSPVDHVHQDYEDGLTALETTVSDFQDQIDDHEVRITDLESGSSQPSGGTNLHFGTYILAKPTTPVWGDPVLVHDSDTSVVVFDTKALNNPVLPSGTSYPGLVGYLHPYWGNRIGDHLSGQENFSPAEGTGAPGVFRAICPVVPIPQSPAELVYLEGVSVVPLIENLGVGGGSFFDYATLNTEQYEEQTAFRWRTQVEPVSGWFPANCFKEAPDYGSGGGPSPL